MSAIEPAGSVWSLTEVGKKAELCLKENEYDLESWSVLVREAQSCSLLRARGLYERVVSKFPTAGRYWRLYIEHEMRSRNYEQVEKLFQRCLMKVLQIDLWKCYITYVRETKSTLPTYREKMKQTYTFALEHVGKDYNSTPVWQEYIQFLKSEEAHGTYAENQKIQTIRKAYQQAVVVPIVGVELLWRDYSAFEQEVNQAMAKKLLESVSRQYVHTKRASVEYETVTRGLVRGGISTPLQGTAQEMQQLQIWRRFIAWEKSNPLRTTDQAELVKRVLYAYEQCLLCFAYSAEVWCEAAVFLQRVSEAGNTSSSEKWLEEVSALYSRAASHPLSQNLLLNFAHADFEELRQHFDKAEEVYKSLLQFKDVNATLVYIQYMKFSRRTGGVVAARLVFKQAREDLRIHHQVFVAAALMEFYITKDKTVAFKIFELGMKRFGDEPKYLLAYLDHLSHLNEENNARVLFEKALSAIPPENAREIWEKFVEFESSVGDLPSLLRVEHRRASAAKDLSDTALLVERYKYLDLLPCCEAELTLIGYHGSTKKGVSVIASGGVSTSGAVKQNISKPDVSQMRAFKPSTLSGVAMNAVPGGYYPPPTACAELLTLLPPPDCFQGPFVQLEPLLKQLKNCSLPEHLEPGAGVESFRVLKRKRVSLEGEEGEEGENPAPPPANDIYRSRQQKRVTTATTS